MVPGTIVASSQVPNHPAQSALKQHWALLSRMSFHTTFLSDGDEYSWAAIANSLN